MPVLLCRCWGGWDLALAHSGGRRSEEECEVQCAFGSDFCGGINTNAVYTLPPPETPEDVPAYEYLGRCLALQVLPRLRRITGAS
jgi:hypothetical protein